MTCLQDFRMDIKTLYLDLALMVQDRTVQTIYEKWVAELKKATGSQAGVIYTYDPAHLCYKKMIENCGGSDFKMVRNIRPVKGQTFSAVLKAAHPGQDFFVVEITEDSSGIMLALSKSDSVKQAAWEYLAEETNVLMDLVLKRHQEEREHEKMYFLFQLSKTFNGLRTKRDILSEMKHALKRRYPIFEYELLLSEEFDTDDTFAAELIPYADLETNRLSTEAFMTGELQVEFWEASRRTCVYAPLTGEQGVYGVLKILGEEGKSIPEEERYFIANVLKIAGKALENAVLYERTTDLVNDLKWMNEVTRELNANLNLKQIVSLVHNRTTEVSGASDVGVVFINEWYEQFQDIQSESTTYFHTEQGRVFSDYIIKQVKNKEESVFAGNFPGQTDVTHYCSVMAVPIMHNGLIEGAVIAVHEEPYYFSLDTLKLVQSFIQHSSLAFSNAILKAELEATVITDYLTQLYTRRHVDEKIMEHMITGKKGTLIFFDIDDFKMINDTYGHHVGDDVIIQVAQIVDSNIPEGAIACRWGGEEIAIYLPEADISDGLKVADTIKENVVDETNPAVTVSCGVASWESAETDTTRNLFARADQALYEAKETGKNKIVLEQNTHLSH